MVLQKEWTGCYKGFMVMHMRAQIRYIAVFALWAGLSIGRAEDDVSAIRDMTSRWVDLNLQAAEERRAWDERKVWLEAEAEALRREREVLIEERDERVARMDAADEDRLQRLKELERIDRVRNDLNTRLDGAEQALADMRERLPESIRPERPDARTDGADESPSRRLQRILAAYTEWEETLNTVHVTQEIVPFPGGAREADVLYLGGAQAYAVTRDRTAAAVARQTEKGLVWEKAPDRARDIQRAIDVAREVKPAQWVFLPIEAPRP